jgi:hypothetical protein
MKAMILFLKKPAMQTYEMTAPSQEMDHQMLIMTLTETPPDHNSQHQCCLQDSMPILLLQQKQTNCWELKEMMNA